MKLEPCIILKFFLEFSDSKPGYSLINSILPKKLCIYSFRKEKHNCDFIVTVSMCRNLSHIEALYVERYVLLSIINSFVKSYGYTLLFTRIKVIISLGLRIAEM